jgi:hypothetical protein
MHRFYGRNDPAPKGLFRAVERPRHARFTGPAAQPPPWAGK